MAHATGAGYRNLRCLKKEQLMALSNQSVSIGGVAKSIIVALDPNSNVAAAHVNVNSSGTEIGTVSNPISVTVGNLPTTQTITAATLPLPTGASTAANQPALNADGGAQSHVMNFPATQAVSAVILPLPTGAAQDGTDASGVASPAGASGIRGWLSGIYAKLSGTLSVGITTALPAGTNTLGAVTGAGTFTVVGQGVTGVAPLGASVAVSGVDGAGLKQYVRTDTFGTPTDAAWSSGSGSLVSLGKALIAAQQATTAAVTTSSLVPPSPTFVQTAASSSNLLLKATAGSLYACYVTTGSTAGFLMLFDATSVPPNGTVAPKDCVYCPANATTEIEFPFLTVEPFSAGITAAFSSTGPFTLTASSTVFIKGIVQ
ncbi:MAG: hypothetical protein ACRYF2_04875 [Janthinobacterium lividum]